jgi:dipeptidyl aminopeptidase/acylaminoacyl peptidase
LPPENDALTIADVLDVEYPGEPDWSADGSRLAATVYEDDGNALLVADVGLGDGTPGIETRRVRPGDGHVTGFEWGTEARATTLAVATDADETYLVDAGTGEADRLAATPSADADHAWSADGTRLAFYRVGTPWVRNLDTGEERGFDVPERGQFLADERMLAFDDADDHLAFRFVERGTTHVGVVALESGELVWRTNGTAASRAPAWLADGRLVYDEVGESGTVRRIVAADPQSSEETVLHEERDAERGVVSSGAPAISPDGTRLALALPLGGWEHVYVIDAGTGDRRQLTAGPFEDKGLAGSTPQWLDDETLVFASNRRDRCQRQLFAVSLAGGDADPWPLVETPGTNVYPRPSPDGDVLAYIHADRGHSPELRVRAVARSGRGGPDATAAHGSPDATNDSPDATARVTRSTVETWPVDPVEPERVTYESHDGVDIDAFLVDPRKTRAVADDAEDLPAVVWVHGGPMRQMRDGWHPSRSYGLAYAVHQYLAHRGYVGLLVNYRGGIGYGKSFRQAIAEGRGDDEMGDVVAGAEYLADLDYVDPDAVGIWGLSYGGYATLQLLGTHPETFAVGVNLAGLADLQLYSEWAYETKYPRAASAEEVRMGGDPHEVPEEWDRASPKTHVEAYEAPLYSFHGTGDRYVNFEQLDVLVDALLEHGKEYDADYYPDESHVFGKRSVWRRTLEKTEQVFAEHLRSE